MPGTARPGADQQRAVRRPERDLRVGRSAHPGQQPEGAVLHLHHDAFECGLCLVERKLQQLQDHRLIRAEHLATGDAEQQAVADLTGGAGDGYADGLLHGRGSWRALARRPEVATGTAGRTAGIRPGGGRNILPVSCYVGTGRGVNQLFYMDI